MIQKIFSGLFFIFCCAYLSAQHTEWREYIERKQFEKVVSQVSALQPADSTDFTKMYLMGQAFEGLLKNREAYLYYKHCYLLDSMRIDLLNTLARICVSTGKTAEAEKYYQKVLEYDNGNFNANYRLARLYISLERYEEGLNYYDTLLENDSTNVEILWAKGDCYAKLGDLEAAMVSYYNAYTENRENALLANTLITTMLKLNDPQFNLLADEALAICDTALLYNPNHKTLRQQKAMIYFVKSDYKKADSVYVTLMSDGDSAFVTLKYCGFSRFYAREFYDAIEPLEKAYQADTTAYDVCLILGICIGRTYNTKKAFSYFEKAENLMQPNVYWTDLLLQFRSEIYARTGDCIKAAELFYQRWKDGRKQLPLLQNILRCYSYRKFDEMPDEDRQRLLFLACLLASELLEKNQALDQSTEYVAFLANLFKKFDEELFFSGSSSLPMLSPDNKRSTLSKEKLKEYLGKL